VTKFIRLTHKIAIQLQLVAESCIICSSLLPRVQSGSGALPISYPMCNGGSLTGVKEARNWSWQLTSF